MKSRYDSMRAFIIPANVTSVCKRSLMPEGSLTKDDNAAQVTQNATYYMQNTTSHDLNYNMYIRIRTLLLDTSRRVSSARKGSQL